jgi:UDP-hydrolysing UDP-N-acetyl-D-glucosamine 2-epimerase
VRKIAVVVASRANWGRLKSVCKAVTEHPDLELQLIVGASAFDLPMDYKPDAVVQCLVEGDNLQAMTLTTGLFLPQIGNILERLKPDFLYLHGDRHELMAPTIAAAYQCIPIAHGEGGEVTGTIDEKVRHMITKAADIHFPATELSRQRIIKMGERPETVFTVGSTALDSLLGIDLTNSRKEPYIVVLHHPNTTAPEDIAPLIEAVMSIPIHKVWVNPNVDAGSKTMLRQIHQQDVEFVKNLPPEEYARLLKNCECAVGNSSSFIKEGAFLGVPAVLVGSRQEGREHGDNVAIVKMDKERILFAKGYMVKYYRKPPRDYRFGDGTAGKQIADILAKVEVKEKKLHYPSKTKRCKCNKLLYENDEIKCPKCGEFHTI